MHQRRLSPTPSQVGGSTESLPPSQSNSHLVLQSGTLNWHSTLSAKTDMEGRFATMLSTVQHPASSPRLPPLLSLKKAVSSATPHLTLLFSPDYPYLPYRLARVANHSRCVNNSCTRPEPHV